MDCTHDQDAGFEQVRKWSASKTSELNSFDLTAATDRLPSELQLVILGTILDNSSLAVNWTNLLSQRPYQTETGRVFYGCGLPMGSKSNWAMLALSHHIIVQAAAKLANIQNFKNYVICGDDIVINSEAVSTAYKKIMTYYGLTINETKSVLHHTTRTPAAEFCKRLVIDGVEYSTIPAKLLIKTTMNGRLLPQFQSELLKRSMPNTGDTLSCWFAALTDKESFGFNSILNLLPPQITGLFGNITLPAGTPNLEEWYSPEHKLTADEVIQAYTYVSVVDQLKRLDALIKQTEVVAQCLEIPFSVFNLINTEDAVEWMSDEKNKKTADAVKELVTVHEAFHPILSAAQDEIARVSQLLSHLTTGDTSLESVVRGQLLDSFRNALISAWEDDQSARAQADRSLIQRALDELSVQIHQDRDEDRVSTFSTMIVSLQRYWVVK
jgi:hypothetical protein